MQPSKNPSIRETVPVAVFKNYLHAEECGISTSHLGPEYYLSAEYLLFNFSCGCTSSSHALSIVPAEEIQLLDYEEFYTTYAVDISKGYHLANDFIYRNKLDSTQANLSIIVPSEVLSVYQEKKKTSKLASKSNNGGQLTGHSKTKSKSPVKYVVSSPPLSKHPKALSNSIHQANDISTRTPPRYENVAANESLSDEDFYADNPSLQSASPAKECLKAKPTVGPAARSKPVVTAASSNSPPTDAFMLDIFNLIRHTSSAASSASKSKKSNINAKDPSSPLLRSTLKKKIALTDESTSVCSSPLKTHTSPLTRHCPSDASPGPNGKIDHSSPILRSRLKRKYEDADENRGACSPSNNQFLEALEKMNRKSRAKVIDQERKTPTKVKKEKKMHQNVKIQLGTVVDKSSSATSKMYNFHHVVQKLKKHGYQVKTPSGLCRLWRYVLPGGKKSGQEGVDYIDGDEAFLEYLIENEKIRKTGYPKLYSFIDR